MLKLVYYIFSFVAIICTKLFYLITKLLHIQGFIYYVLGIFGGLPSIIYILKIHIPSSKLEKKENFDAQVVKDARKYRHNTIAMIAFYPWSIFFAGIIIAVILDSDSDFLIGFFALIALVVPFFYAFYKIHEWTKQEHYNLPKSQSIEEKNADEQNADEQNADEQNADEQDAEEQDAEEQDAEEQDAEEQDAEEHDEGIKSYSFNELIDLENKTHGADVQAELGSCYAKGNGTETNYENAFFWYKKSAEQGNALGQLRLGVLYLTGLGTEKNEAESFLWIKKAANQGNAQAQGRLAFMYSSGCGTDKDNDEVFAWSLKSAEQGDPMGQKLLGDCYLNGYGTEKDFKKAYEWFYKSAEQGNVDAKKILSELGKKE